MENNLQTLNTDLSRRVAVDTQAMDWTESPGGHVLRKRVHLSGPAESGQVTSVVRYLSGARFPAHDHPGGEEILVLDGVFSDEHGHWPAGSYRRHSWLRIPAGDSIVPTSGDYCEVYIKEGGFPYLL